METLRLRRLQQPSRLEKLLEAFVSRGGFLPKDSHQVRAPSALPSPLRRVLVGEIERGRVWACWVSDSQTWLFTCEMLLPSSRERGAPVLKVNCYDKKGELKETGSWAADHEGTWRRCSE
jgi:hypothetical protein